MCGGEKRNEAGQATLDVDVLLQHCGSSGSHWGLWSGKGTQERVIQEVVIQEVVVVGMAGRLDRPLPPRPQT